MSRMRKETVTFFVIIIQRHTKVCQVVGNIRVDSDHDQEKFLYSKKKNLENLVPNGKDGYICDIIDILNSLLKEQN